MHLTHANRRGKKMEKLWSPPSGGWIYRNNDDDDDDDDEDENDVPLNHQQPKCSKRACGRPAKNRFISFRYVTFLWGFVRKQWSDEALVLKCPKIAKGSKGKTVGSRYRSTQLPRPQLRYIWVD